MGQGSPGNGNINQEDLTDVENSDYGALIQEVKDSVMQASQSPCFSLVISQTFQVSLLYCVLLSLLQLLFSPEEDRRSLPRSRTWSPFSHTGGGGMSPSENTADSGTIVTANKAATIISTSTKPIPANHTLTTDPVALTSSPGLDSVLPTPSSAPLPARSTLAGPLSSTPPGPRSQWKGQVRGLYDLACENAVCSLNSVCIDDYQSGGSRCYCALGRGGDACSQGETREPL